MPPQARQCGSSSPARTRASASSIGARRPHCQHMTRRMLPCTSTTLSGDEPARWCSSSMFWVTSACRMPRRSSATRARWPAFGSADHAGESRRDRHAAFLTSRIGEVVLDRRLLLGGRVARPHALRAAEVGDARLGRDAGAGEHDDAARGVDAPARVVDRIARRHAVPQGRSRSGRRATKSISTSAPLASAVTPMQVRAGRRPASKWLAYAAFMPA